MKFTRFLLACTVSSVLVLPAAAMTHTRRGPTAPKLFSKKSVKSGKALKSSKTVGQRGIDDSRASEIQTALIKQGYLSGEATGHWDAPTEAAMQKLQADNGWQTKLIPDSRAIIKLGLGPVREAEQTSAATGTFNQ